MSKTVLIACKLPNGIVLDLPNGEKVTLNGTNTALLNGAPGLTHVDESKWMLLSTLYAKHTSFESQAIFAHNTSDKVADVIDKAADLSEIKTGLEGIDPLNPGDKAITVEEGAKAAIEQAAAQPKVRVKKAQAKADQAAAVEAATGAA